MKFKIGDKVVVHDRKLKVHTFSGEILGIEPSKEARIYNVLVKIQDKNGNDTKTTKHINLLENQLTKEIKNV